jgi:hypothetical protein
MCRIFGLQSDAMDSIEGIVLHSFEGKAPFSEENLKRIADLKKIYGLDLTSQDSHNLVES